MRTNHIIIICSLSNLLSQSFVQQVDIFFAAFIVLRRQTIRRVAVGSLNLGKAKRGHQNAEPYQHTLVVEIVATDKIHNLHL